MDEDKKYSIIGRVEIGTDEYRELIERAMKAEAESDDYRRKYWAEQEITRKQKEKIEAQEKVVAHYREFVNANAERIEAYKMFLVSKHEE